MRTATNMFPLFFALFALLVSSLPGNASNQPGPIDRIPQLPDLSVSEVTKVVTRPSGQVIKDEIWVQVTNSGLGRAGAFEVSVQWGQGYANQQAFFWISQGLTPGQSIWLEVSAQGYDLWNGNFQVVADSSHSVTESDETNNVYSHFGP